MKSYLNIHMLHKHSFSPSILQFKSISSDALDCARKANAPLSEKKDLKMKLADQIQAVFKKQILTMVQESAKTKEHGEACCETVQKLWGEVYKRLRLNSGVQDPTDVLKTKVLLKMSEELKELILAIEPRGFNLIDGVKHKEETVQLHVLRSLVSSLPFFDSRLIDKKLIYNIFLSCDEEYIVDLREGFKRVFDTFHERLIDKDEIHDDFVVDMVKDHLLSIYVFTEPKDGDTLHIPQIINGKIERVNYKLKRIPLISQEEFNQNIDAYAFEPIGVKSPPYIVYRGTTFPSAPGSFLGYMSDFFPNKAVGEWLFDKGKETIKKQVESMYAKQGKVFVLGLSLGGSLAQFTSRLLPEKTICRAIAPAGVLKRQIDHFSDINGISYAHPHCPVHRYIGYLPRADNYKQIEVLEENKRGLYDAHVSLYGVRPSILLKIKPIEENTRSIRKIGTLMHRTASLFIGPACKGILLLGKIFSR